MNGPIKLVCLRPANPICLDVQQTLVPSPAKNEVVVRVEACSVNPVDVKPGNRLWPVPAKSERCRAFFR